ncbi:hypothetical protein WJX81_008186 [Elliptochloris bilobata]|uniref:FAD-binding FR-type domain-containing protein n=1 Tax=Elliptochloris bilobata TaxID=381761 RepID=A0AAW1S920_9CHLO
MVQLHLDVGALSDGYTKPGQCVQVKVGDSKPAYMAIASAPAAKGSEIELLVKNQGPTAELLCSVKEGDFVDVSPVIGSGFPVDRAPPEKYPTLVVFATGTGIAPIKALIESSALDVGRRKDVRIYYGTFNPDSTAYADLKAQWEAEGVRVINVYSGFGQGYVQDVFTKEPGVEDWAGVSAVLCGQKELAESVTAYLSEKGVNKEAILTNW